MKKTDTNFKNYTFFITGEGVNGIKVTPNGIEIEGKIFGELEKFSIIKKYLYPTKIIYNPPYTICYFGDEKVIVKCSEFDEFKPDFGVMACIMRRLFNTRAEFDRLVESGNWQEPKEKK